MWKMNKMRPVGVAFPSMKPRITLFPDTEDEVTVDVRSAKRGTPYALYCGVKYYLTEEETRMIRNLMDL